MPKWGPFQNTFSLTGKICGLIIVISFKIYKVYVRRRQKCQPNTAADKFTLKLTSAQENVTSQ